MKRKEKHLIMISDKQLNKTLDKYLNTGVHKTLWQVILETRIRIELALTQTKGDVSKTAKLLKISPQTIKKYRDLGGV